MMYPTAETRLWLVFDTDQEYTGSFERPMVAYITGIVGGCGVGEEEARLMPSGELADWCDTGVALRPDDRGCLRPATIAPGPDGLSTDSNGRISGYTSVAVALNTEPPDVMALAMHQRAVEFGQIYWPSTRWGVAITIIGGRMIEERTKVTQKRRWEGHRRRHHWRRLM